MPSVLPVYNKVHSKREHWFLNAGMEFRSWSRVYSLQCSLCIEIVRVSVVRQLRLLAKVFIPCLYVKCTGSYPSKFTKFTKFTDSISRKRRIWIGLVLHISVLACPIKLYNDEFATPVLIFISSEPLPNRISKLRWSSTHCCNIDLLVWRRHAFRLGNFTSVDLCSYDRGTFNKR